MDKLRAIKKRRSKKEGTFKEKELDPPNQSDEEVLKPTEQKVSNSNIIYFDEVANKIHLPVEHGPVHTDGGGELLVLGRPDRLNLNK